MTTTPVPPLFVIGAQRSGTTMLRLMLNRHPDVVVPFESGFITEFIPRQAEFGDLADPANAARLLSAIAAHPLVKKGDLIQDPKAILARPISDYASLCDAIFSVYAEGQGKRRWGDKTPSYVTEIDQLWRLFPGCKILHIVRDGRDVALSNLRVGWGIHNLPRAAHDWRWKTLLAHKMGALLGPNYFELRYEELVTAPEQHLRRICEFLDLQYDPRMLSYHETATNEMPQASLDWHRNSVRAPDSSLIYAWKKDMPKADRIIFEQIASDA
ncbi:MAG: sulfotransferase, partial [Burkholderiales bacterium]